VTEAAVRLEGVTRRFGSTVAISDVAFELRPGEVVGLLGPNGAGKTTTMRVLTGYLRPSAGRVTVGGVDPLVDPVGARRLVGYMPESAAVPGELSVTGYLRYCARLRRVGGRRAVRAAAGRAIERAGLTGVAGQRVSTLSKGYRQRVALAQALVHDPPVLVLDEPTSGLDPRQVADTRELIARLGRKRTVLLSSHLLGEVGQLCRRVVVLDRGRVVADSDVAGLTAAAGSLEKAYLKLVTE
jgi:ABC-2 type transport system ATP-binding protein